MDKRETVAIIGLGAVLPDALDIPAVWANMVTGHSSVRPVPPEIWDLHVGLDPTREDSDKSYSPVAAVVRGFEFKAGDFGLPPIATHALDPTQQVALVAARQALSDAGIDAPTDGLRAAVILGNLQGGAQKRGECWFRVSHGALEQTLAGLPAFQLLSTDGQQGLLEELREAWHEQFPVVTGDALPGLLGNISASRIAHHYDFTGPAMVVDAACASSLAAVEQAIAGLLDHRFDLAVSGGTDMQMDLPSYAGFCAMGALAPEGSYPFDERANGFVMGEGSVAFVLKRQSDALRDGDNIYATIRGIGSSSDGRGRSIVAPNPRGQILAMRQAYATAGIEPTDIGYLEAHGTSTPLGDPTEIAAIREVFGAAPVGSIPMGSIKGNIGHLKGAAGAAGMLRAILALHHQTIPPHANFERPNPHCEFDTAPVRITTAAEPWTHSPRYAAVSAFGFGGVNYHVVLQQGDGSARTQVQVPATPTDLPLGLGVFAFGGESRDALLSEARRLRADLGDDPLVLARTCARTAAPSSRVCRIAFFAEDTPGAKKQLDGIITTLEMGGSQARLEALGVILREDEATFGPNSAAFMSPGQGSQYLGMMDELRGRFPSVQQTLDEADEIMSPLLDQELSSYISPPPEKDQSEAFVDLLRTEVLQPAMLACDAALHRLISPVVTPRAVLGHSLGEYGACIAAGVLKFEDALRIVAARGEAMEEVPLDDNGLMLGVNADAATVQNLVADIDGYVAVVNKNCPSQTIIGGATPAIQAAQEKLQSAGFDSVLLPVSHAFHSEIVAPASAPLRRALDKIEINPPHLPILSNVTGDFYPDADTDETREWIRATLAKQVAATVEFIAEVEHAYAAGCRVFVEMGPKRAQAGFVSSILEGRPHRSVYLAHPKNGELVQFGRGIAALVADGVIPYGRPVVKDTLEQRPPYVRTVAASAHTRAAQAQPAAPAAGGLLEDLAADPSFWQFVSLQGPAIINSLAASYQAARALAAQPGAAALPTQAVPALPMAASAPPAMAAPGAVPTPTPIIGAPTEVAHTARGNGGAAQVSPGSNGGKATAGGNGKTTLAIPQPGASGEELTHWVLGRVAEITGYQTEELDLDAHLEAELGIDSIRQIEIILGLRDELELESDGDDNFRVSDYPNLRSLVTYLHGRMESATF